MNEAAETGDVARLGWVRVLVFTVLATTSAVVALALPLALEFYDDKADVFSSLTYQEREYGVWPGVPIAIRDRDVVDVAAAEMPSAARYRVIIGPDWVTEWKSNASRSVETDFLRFHLLPRVQTASEEARWVFCFKCDLRALGDEVRVVADGPSGLRFVEVLR